ncbi:MAG: DNA repair exonuclease [Thermoanaerobaculia bacterium]|nr:DNA repair exonuclease [Thermoanaerobaculia bacterium]
MSLEILHVADVHLGASFSAFGDVADERGRAVLKAFTALPERAREHGVHAVLVAGDLFDDNEPSRECLAAARDVFRRLEEEGRRVFVVPGNHDSAVSHPNPYREALGGAHVFDGPRFGSPETVETPAGPLHVYGLCYDPATETDPLSSFRHNGEPGFHVVLLHGAVRFAPHWADSPSSLRLDPEALESLEADYIALGDYHRFRRPSAFDPDGSIPACYPGSFAAVDLTETGPKGPVVVSLSRKGLAVDQIPGSVPFVHEVGEVDVSAVESPAAVAERVAELTPEGAYPLVTVTGQPGCPLDPESVEIELRQRFGAAFVRDETTFYSAAFLDDLAEQDTVAGHVVRRGRRRIETAKDSGERKIEDRALRIVLRELEVR